MPATQLSNGSICTKVQLQTHLSISGTEDNGIRTATEFFLVQWSPPTSAPTPATAYPLTVNSELATDGTTTIPVRGDLHFVDTSRAASRIEARPCENDTHLIHQVRVEYTDDISAVINPLLVQADIQWDVSASGQVPYFLDNDPAGSKPCVNKAGQRFSEFLQRYNGEVSATFSINCPLTGTTTGFGGHSVTAYSPATAIQYCAGGTNQSSPATNTDTFTFDSFNVAIGQAIAKSYTCSGVQIQNGVKYRTKKWVLAFRDKGWNDIIENRGFEQLFTLTLPVLGSVSALVPIDSHLPPGSPPSAPWPLNNSGGAMANCTDIPPLLTFYPYPQLAFASLGFY